MVSCVLLLTTALAAYASATLVGVRTVCEKEKDEIKKVGSVFKDDKHWSAKLPSMLGAGKSHSNKDVQWEGLIAGNNFDDWFCYTTGDAEKIRKATKAWINPNMQPPEGETSYPYDEAKIQDLLRKKGFKHPEKALRMGLVNNGHELLIPNAQLPDKNDKTGGPLKLRTYCFRTKQEMYAHMQKNKDVTAMDADYFSDIFANEEHYRVVDQTKKRATIDEGEGEGEAAAGPTRPLRFMPRNSKKTTKGSGRQGTTASGFSSNTPQLAPGYIITLQRDPNSKKFPNPKVECPANSGEKPKVIASGKKSNTGGKKKPNTGGKKKSNTGGKKKSNTSEV